MIPTSPMILAKEHGHRRPSLRHGSFGWTPPETDCESTPLLQNLQPSNHYYSTGSRLRDNNVDAGPSRHYNCLPRTTPPESLQVLEFNNAPRQGLPLSSFQFQTPLLIEGTSDHRMATTASCSKRSIRHVCRNNLPKHCSDREITAAPPTEINTRKKDRRTRGIAKFSSRYVASSSLSPSRHRNKIFVRIKRVKKEKSVKFHRLGGGDVNNRVRFDPSITMPGVHMNIVNHFHHYHHHHDEYNNRIHSSAEQDSNFRHFETAMIGEVENTRQNPNLNVSSSMYSFSNEKLVVTKRLLALEAGPIPWFSIDESNGPPEAFVWYLAKVLTDGVQMYLENNAGKEYWIKHVQFWSDILNPASDWWNGREGSLYKDVARILYARLRRRWGNSTFIECCADARSKNLFVRACIVFAKKSQKNGTMQLQKR